MLTSSVYRYKRARAKDADLLTELSKRSKAHWGYSQEWMTAWCDELTITASYIEQYSVIMLIIDNETVGFYGLEFHAGVAHLGHLWIEPTYIGLGLGKRLLRDACQKAVNRGYTTIELIADPNAEDFYIHNKFVRVGEVHGEVLGTPRVLPKMQLQLFSEPKKLM